MEGLCHRVSTWLVLLLLLYDETDMPRLLVQRYPVSQSPLDHKLPVSYGITWQCDSEEETSEQGTVFHGSAESKVLRAETSGWSLAGLGCCKHPRYDAGLISAR